MKLVSGQPQHNPLECVQVPARFLEGQIVVLAANHSGQGIFEHGVRYRVEACQTHAYPYGQVTDIVVSKPDETLLVVRNVWGIVLTR